MDEDDRVSGNPYGLSGRTTFEEIMSIGDGVMEYLAAHGEKGNMYLSITCLNYDIYHAVTWIATSMDTDGTRVWGRSRRRKEPHWRRASREEEMFVKMAAFPNEW